ncbi:16028_t:CDS:2, partial [Entrophospora sp. SA101]
MVSVVEPGDLLSRIVNLKTDGVAVESNRILTADGSVWSLGSGRNDPHVVVVVNNGT